MNWRFGVAGICGLMMEVGIASPPSLESGIRVRLYDYAGVSAPSLAGAKADASAILGRAGIRVKWAECPLCEGDAPMDDACRLPITPVDLQMRILDRGMAERVHTTRHCLGYALLAGGAGSIAAVFFHRALDLERGNLATGPAILGAMMAHEIGHLLLGRADHSDTGILRGSWGDADLKLIAKGRMRFTAEQARLMASTVSTRNQAIAPR